MSDTEALATKTVLWRLPPVVTTGCGCSAGLAGRNRRATLTDAQFAALADQAICRCAVSVRDKAHGWRWPDA